MFDAELDRRAFLKKTLFGVGAALMGPQVFLRLARAAPLSGDETILVVVQLSGGNDGLSTVIPHGDDAYYRARRATAIPRKDVIRIDDYHGFHPGLAPLHALWESGKLTVVQGASYPDPTRSHFESMDVWHAGARAGRREGAGWLGRAIDRLHPDAPSPNLLVSVGRNVPFALAARTNKPVSVVDPRQARIFAREEPVCESCDPKARSGESGARPSAELEEEFLRRVAADARASSRKMAGAIERYAPKADYPQGRLAASLRTIAALVVGRLDARVFYAELGGFDTHAQQRGRHDALMRELGAALAAFQADLEKQGAADRVAVVTFSEFGRRVKENASGGTDHGVAGPMFVLGSKVRGGLATRHPSLTDLDAGDLKMTTDFRSVYATVLEDWLGVRSEDVLGGAFPKLPLFAPSPKPARRTF